MKYGIKLTITRIDPQAELKGEELDSAVESAIQDIDVDGYEVTNVDVERDAGPSEKLPFWAQTAIGRIKTIKGIVEQDKHALRIVEGTDDGDKIRKLCEFLIEDLEVVIKSPKNVR